MKKLTNKDKLNYYVKEYEINNIFSTDMTSFMELFHFDKDEYIYKANDKINYLYFFVEGKAKVFTLLANGKSLLLMFCTPLRILGDVEFLDSNTANCNLQALKDCLCIGISLEDIRKYAANDSTFLRYMCQSLSKKLTNCSLISSINLLYPLENRLASYILAIIPEGETSPLEEMETQKLTEISELLGTSYRHLIRVLNKLCEKEIIKKEGNLLEVVSREELKRLAGDLYQ